MNDSTQTPYGIGAIDSGNGYALQVLVASGDCFEMLASNLDKISHGLPDNDPNQPELEQVIRTLLELQRGYQITPKSVAG